MRDAENTDADLPKQSFSCGCGVTGTRWGKGAGWRSPLLTGESSLGVEASVSHFHRQTCALLGRGTESYTFESTH